MEDNIEKKVYYLQVTGPVYNGLKFKRGPLRQAQLQKISIGASWASQNYKFIHVIKRCIIFKLLGPYITGSNSNGARYDRLNYKRFL